MVRMRRSQPKTFRQRNYFQPNREIIKEYQNRAAGLGVDEAVIDEMIMLQKLKEKDPHPGVHHMTGEGRKAALKRQAELEAKMPNQCELRVLGPTGRDELQQSWIYFNPTKTCFVLVHIDNTQNIQRMSMTYPSKDLLMLSWELGRVLWVEKKSIEP